MTRPIWAIRQEFDFQGFLDDNGVDYIPTGSELRVNCPHCGETDHKFYVNIEKNLYNCFKCNFNSRNNSLTQFVALLKGIRNVDAFFWLQHEYAEVAPSEDDILAKLNAVDNEYFTSNPIKVLEGLPDGMKPIAEDTSLVHHDYLLARGLSPAEITVMQTHYCAKPVYLKRADGKYGAVLKRRVVWPVYAPSGDLISWVSRTIDNDPRTKSKYLNAPDSDLKKVLWPAAPPMRDQVVIVEGMLDCVSVRRTGYEAFATFGKKISKEQLCQLARWDVKNIIIFYDEDAKEEIKKMVERLSSIVDKTYVVDYTSLAGRDPGDMLNEDPSKLKTILDNCINTESLEYLRWCL